LDGHEERIDCRRVNEHKHRFGQLAYIVEGARELCRIHGIPLHIVADGRLFEFNALMALIFNGKTAGGFRIAPRSILRDGLFECLFLQRQGIFRSIATMLYLVDGHPSGVMRWQVRHIEITSTIDEPTDKKGRHSRSE
jgi:diacylglycerol kinase family enzyme